MIELQGYMNISLKFRWWVDLIDLKLTQYLKNLHSYDFKILCNILQFITEK